MEKGCTNVQDCTGTLRNYECFRKGVPTVACEEVRVPQYVRGTGAPPRRGESFGMAAATYCTTSVQSNIDSIYDTYIRTFEKTGKAPSGVEPLQIKGRVARTPPFPGRTPLNLHCCTHTPWICGVCR